MSSNGDQLLNSLLFTYLAAVFICWVTANRLTVGLLFQKQIYVFSLFILLGAALDHIMLLAFPNAEIAGQLLPAISIFIGTLELHKDLLSKVQSPRHWNVVISTISAVLFVILLLSNV